jgi:hypothetical protein
MPEHETSTREELKKLLMSPYTTAASTILPAVLTYALSRRVKKMAPEHEALAAQIRENGLGVVAEHKRQPGKLEALLRYGTPNAKARGTDLPKNLGAVYSPIPPQPTDHARTFGNAHGHPLLNATKIEENRYVRTHAPDAMPLAHPIEPELTAASDLRADQSLPYLQEQLRAKHPNGYVLKPVVGSGAKPMTEQHNLLAEFEKMHRYDPDFRHKLPSSSPISSVSLNELRAHAVHDPELFLDLAKSLPKDLQNSAVLHGALQNPALLMSQDRIKLDGELRIHALGSRVLDKATAARHNRFAGARTMLGLKTSTEREVERHVEQLLKHFPEADMHQRPLAIDAGYHRDKDGKLHVHLLDMNSSGWSGLLKTDKPEAVLPTAITANKYFSQLSGQDTQPLAVAKALGAGAAGGLALEGARAIAGEPEEDDPLKRM